VWARPPLQHPTAPALQSLLSAAPLLCVRLEGPPSLERWLRLSRIRSGSSADLSRTHQAQWEALQRMETELRPRVAWLGVADE